MLSYVLVLLAIALRVLSGTGYFSMMGFAPLSASLLFYGSHQPRKRMWIPLALLMVSDVYITVFKYHMSLPWDQALIWATYAGICILGYFLKGRIKPLNVGGAAVASALAFFLVSNFGVWMSGYVGYAHNLAGLITCYIAAIPFLERGLVSDLLFSAVFFSLPVLIAKTREASPAGAHKNTAV